MLSSLINRRYRTPLNYASSYTITGGYICLLTYITHYTDVQRMTGLQCNLRTKTMIKRTPTRPDSKVLSSCIWCLWFDLGHDFRGHLKMSVFLGAPNLLRSDQGFHKRLQYFYYGKKKGNNFTCRYTLEQFKKSF